MHLHYHQTNMADPGCRWPFSQVVSAQDQIDSCGPLGWFPLTGRTLAVRVVDIGTWKMAKEGKSDRKCSGASGLAGSVTMRDGHAPAASGQGT